MEALRRKLRAFIERRLGLLCWVQNPFALRRSPLDILPVRLSRLGNWRDLAASFPHIFNLQGPGAITWYARDQRFSCGGDDKHESRHTTNRVGEDGNHLAGDGATALASANRSRSDVGFEKGDWFVGVELLTADEERAKSLQQLVRPRWSNVGWFGYQGEEGEPPSLAFWFYCGSGETRRKIASKLRLRLKGCSIDAIRPPRI